jgi:hypothetical protein
MKDSDLTKLRRARARVTMRIDQLEPQLAGYRAKLAELEARIYDLAPELNLPARRYSPNPHFARGELPRLAMNIMRAAGEPLATREIAVRDLAMRGVTLPDRRAMKLTRLRLQQMFCDWQAKGWVVRSGRGKTGKRALVD